MGMATAIVDRLSSILDPYVAAHGVGLVYRTCSPDGVPALECQ